MQTRWIRHMTAGLLLGALAATPAVALPDGFSERFAGCRKYDEGAEKQQECCGSVADECMEECQYSPEVGALEPEDAKKYVEHCSAGCGRAKTECSSTSDSEEEESGD